ncbi:MAG TPA: efflux RND transporter periplasmic adaptor subunit [Steroidobacteraceae bacterium]|nr:efflux RND transporter periplasmic adaptor subunit [Steroidobacteraceae bacterium]
MSLARSLNPRGLGAVAVLIVGVGAGYWWGHRQAAPSLTPAAAGATQGEVLYWYDPMVPTQHFDKPGKSPFMDMQLVPKYAEAADQTNAVRVSPALEQNLGIRLGRVERASLPARVRAVGSIAFDERLLELVQSRVDGYITELNVKAPLARVRRGQGLATVLAPQWLEAQQEYLTLLDAQSQSAPALRAAARERLTVLGVPDAVVRSVEETRRANPYTVIRAPIDGVVTELGAREGASFAAGTVLFRINGLTRVWANAQIPEARAAVAVAGSAVEARAAAWPGMVFKGQVLAVLPQVDSQTRTLTARVAIDNREFRLTPGMWVDVDFTEPAAAPQLFVPSEAVITTGRRSIVIVAKPGGSFDVAQVSTGLEEEGKTVILSGLTEGQSVVLSGQFLIDSEASLTATLERLTASGAPPPAQQGGTQP